MTHICVGKQTSIGSDNGLSPGRRQAIIWTNAELLLIGPLGTNFSEISIKKLTFSYTKMRLKVSSAKWRPFCLGLNVLNLTELISLIWGEMRCAITIPSHCYYRKPFAEDKSPVFLPQYWYMFYLEMTLTEGALIILITLTHTYIFFRC